MKKITALMLMCCMIFSTVASAYDSNNLPEYMSFSEALGIDSASEITSAQIINLDDGTTVDITVAKAKLLYNGLKNIKTKLTITPTPFSGIALSFTTSKKTIGYYTNSGIQIGKYGQNNFICYMPVENNEYISNVRALYHEAKNTGEMLEFPVNEKVDFLKLPSAEWAVPGVKEAAAKSLLPYSLTDNYDADITREEFCILMGNMIAVCGNYKNVGDYMRDNETIYQKSSFIDCEDVDESVGILHTLGIINGKSPTHFYPDASITREEATKMIALSAELFMPLYADDEMTFTDKEKISTWAEFYASWCNEHGIMMGDESGNFNPKDNFTVSEAVITVNRLYNLIYNL